MLIHLLSRLAERNGDAMLAKSVKLFWRAVITAAAIVVNYPCYVYDHSFLKW